MDEAYERVMDEAYELGEKIARERFNQLVDAFYKADKNRVPSLPERHGYPEVPPPDIQATRNGQGLPECSGIYFVRRRNVWCYVGQSINLKNRARLSHENIIDGDLLAYLPFDQFELNYAEAFYIGILRPARNFGEKIGRAVDRHNQGRRKYGCRLPERVSEVQFAGAMKQLGNEMLDAVATAIQTVTTEVIEQAPADRRT